MYRVGHRAPSLEARYLAATLACGEGACLSGRAAAHLYGLLKGAAPPPEVTGKSPPRGRNQIQHDARPAADGGARQLPLPQPRHAWERDRRRDREARARGDELRRYTWGDVFEQPDLMLAELRTFLT